MTTATRRLGLLPVYQEEIVHRALDLRDVDAHRRDGVLETIRQEMHGIAARRGVSLSEERINADAPVPCDAQLLGVLEESCAVEGANFQRMVSRAYHDTSFMARIAPVAMLFIPCRAGVSHRPDEFVSEGALARGVRVLARALARLAAD